MSLNTAILAPFRVGGVIGLSGAVFKSLIKTIQTDKEGRFNDKMQNLPMFIYHGKADEVILYEIAIQSYELLKDAGFSKMDI